MATIREDLVTMLPRLRRFSMAVAGNAQDAEDLLHSALERALRSEASWQRGTRLDSWMFRIIRNLWIDERRARRHQDVPLDVVGEAALVDGRETAEQLLDLAQARRALLALPEEQRSVLCLVVIEGMTYQQTADTLGIPIGTVMSRLSRARAAMVSRMSNDPLRMHSRRS